MTTFNGDNNGNSFEGTDDDDIYNLFGGNDVVFGSDGGDILFGGTGNDRVVYNLSDTGVQVSLDNAFGTGAGDDAAGDQYFSIEDVSGSLFDDLIQGNDDANSISGNNGNDTLKGAGGNDFLEGDRGTDNLIGGDGDDRLSGGANGDTLDGGAGIDTADYSASAIGFGAAITVNLETGVGSAGNALGDTYFSIENVNGTFSADSITGNGVDNRLSGFGGADTLKGGGGNDDLFGGIADDSLVGGVGDDFLNGGTGNDTMIGNDGDDTFIVDSSADIVNEVLGSGIDTVFSDVSFSLTSSDVQGDVENVTLTGFGNLSVSGNALDNRLLGNSGSNSLNGREGADRMVGFGGNDTYRVDNTGDIVDEGGFGTSGTDRVISTISFNLGGPKVVGPVENLTLSGDLSLTGIGNSLNNIIFGNTGGNLLSGLGGNDTVNGGLGADVFLFNAALSSTTNVDTISDFNVADDTIRLENAFMSALNTGTLAASAFRIGAAAADATDRIIYNSVNGDLFYDADGTGANAAILFAELDPNLALTSADFVII
jgi:Ca2+-binding RTX toxin-like protein